MYQTESIPHVAYRKSAPLYDRLAALLTSNPAVWTVLDSTEVKGATRGMKQTRIKNEMNRRGLYIITRTTESQIYVRLRPNADETTVTENYVKRREEPVDNSHA